MDFDDTNYDDTVVGQYVQWAGRAGV